MNIKFEPKVESSRGRFSLHQNVEKVWHIDSNELPSRHIVGEFGMTKTRTFRDNVYGGTRKSYLQSKGMHIAHTRTIHIQRMLCIGIITSNKS